MEEYLEKIYSDPKHEAGFSGVEKLFRFVKKEGVFELSRKQIKQWLEGNDTYTLHRPVRRKFTRSRVIAYGMDDVWQMDLADLSSISRHNSGYKYLLTCIDVLSKFAWVIPLKDKTGKSLVSALKQIIQSSKREPYHIQTDKGTEFTNKQFQSFLKEKDILFYTTQNTVKACVVERFNRSIKERMYKYFTHRNTLKYMPVLTKLVHAYNNSYHRSIKTKPILVNKGNEGDVWKTLYESKSKSSNVKSSKYSVGERVRISKAKRTFEKGYLPNWTEEVFNVKQKKKRDVPVYDLVDDHGEKVLGTFYEQELQKVNKGKDDVYRVEKILKKRKRGGKTEYLVKFLGYPSSFNQWVDNIQKSDDVA